ncbi:MAG: THUMP domain-containing protein [Desulfobacteraceae bacterium]|nr:THUMP domain-containing protein [Desulfobacteraceae bacterium]
MFAYQKTNRYFAQIGDGLEELGGEELASLGAREVKPVFRGISFEAERAVLYRINYCSRLCTRILAPLLRFDCHSDRYLYRTARNLPWEELLPLGATFAVGATVAHSRISHSQFAALRLKDAVVDRLRELRGKRPDVDRREPDLQLNLHIENNVATIALDTSGGSLHRRGYRLQAVEAPMQETLAAAIIRLSGWDGERPLVDPMCGSGTLLAEAHMHACRIPAGSLRGRFGCERLPDFDPALWQAVKGEADRAVRTLPAGLVSGSDMDKDAVAAARANLAALPGGGRVHLAVRRFEELPGIANAVIVCNPPYGLRLKKGEEMGGFMQALGDFLKRRCTGSTAFLYLGRRELVKSVGLRPAWKKPLKNGGLDGLLVKYELY